MFFKQLLKRGKYADKKLDGGFGKGAKINACTQNDVDLSAPRPPDVSFDISKALKMGFQPNSISRELELLKALKGV